MQYRAQQFRLYPTEAQAEQMAHIAGACRYVYNLALEQRREWWRPGRRFSYVQQARELTALRREVDWLRDCPVHALQSALRDVQRAYQNWWAGRAAAPRFRKKGDRDSYRHPDPATFDVRPDRRCASGWTRSHRHPDPATFDVRRIGKKTGMVKIPKVGWVKDRGWFDRPGKPKNLTVLRRAGRWYISITKAVDVAEPAPSTLPAVSIDRGVAVTLATSDGDLIQGPDPYRRAQK